MSWFNKKQPRIIKVEDPNQVEKLCRNWDRYVDSDQSDNDHLRIFWTYADSICNFPKEKTFWQWKNPKFHGTFVIFEEKMSPDRHQSVFQ